MKSPHNILIFILVLILFTASAIAAAEEQKENASSGVKSSTPAKADADKLAATNADGAKAAPKAAGEGVAAVKPVAKAKSEAPLSRWVELQTANISTRYRYIENSKGVVTTNQAQYKDEFKARFKFDKKGNYTINAGVFSGNNFTGSWNNTGAGTGDPFTNLYLKQLYFAAKPIKGVELQYGGLYLLRGETSEITSYDNDGYIMGERLSIKRPRDLFFDELSVTYGYLGDTSRPNINKRFNRLQKSNYHQFLVGKNLGKRAALSVDYTFVSGVETMRETVKVNATELRVIDSFRFENYQRTDVKPDYGYSIYGEKTLHKRLTLGAGLADVDRYFNPLNADRFGIGRRFFVESRFVLSPELSVSAFYQHAVATDYAIANKTRFDLVVTYNLLRSLQRTGLF